jgi:hypothetical protein
MTVIPQITHIETKPGYKLYINFRSGGLRLFDMRPYINKGVFKELRDEKYFKKVRLIWGGVEWPHEQDLSAETLYHRSRPIKSPNKSLQRTPTSGAALLNAEHWVRRRAV